MNDGLPDRSAAQQQDLQSGVPGILRPVRRDADPITRSQHRELTFANRMPGRSDGAAAAEHVDQCVVIPMPPEVEFRSGFDGGVRQGDRGAGRTGAAMAVDVTGDDPNQGATV